jgi:3-(3-hydroxy-phenyl)propionate hydroxylase
MDSDRVKQLDAIRRAIPVTRMVDYGVALATAEIVHRETSESTDRSWDDVCEAHARQLQADNPLSGEVDWSAVSALLQCAQLPLNDDAGRKKELYHAAQQAMSSHCATHREIRQLVLDTPTGKIYGWEVAPTGAAIGGVLIVGGLTGWGSVYLGQAQTLAARGFHVVLAEGPGQGLTRIDTGMTLSHRTSSIFSYFVDHLVSVTGSSIGVWGNSFGGLFAANIAIADSRVHALCVNGAPSSPVVPRFRTARESMYPLFGTTDDDELALTLDNFAIVPSVQRVDGAVLVVGGGADPLVGTKEQDAFLLLTTDDRRSTMFWPDGEHTVYNHSIERNEMVSDWFAEQLQHGREIADLSTPEESTPEEQNDTTTEPTDVDADITIVGLGPSGLTLASLLGQQGHSVAVVERWPELYGKPRLTHIDGETARLLSYACDAEEALRDSWTTPQYGWFNTKGQMLLDVAAGNSHKMLWSDHLAVHQPDIERALLDRIEAAPNVRLLRGYTADGLMQDESGAVLTATERRRNSERGTEPRTIRVRSRFLVGSDGSNSFVREAMGISRHDFGFNERWMCVDTEPLAPLPAKFDSNAVQMCDPARGYMFIPIGRKRQRFEFALLDNEKTEDMDTPEAAFRMLKQYHDIDAENVELIRNLVYTFECRLANQWRKGNVFLVGDAAHTNPPYMGQGACSGIRDAINLAWKLDLVVRGVADESLLDTYELERKPHAKQLMLASRSLGKVANTTNRVLATLRDLMFRFNVAPKPKFPVLTAGVLRRTTSGSLQPGAGTVPGQGKVEKDHSTTPFDDILEFGFVLIAREDVLARQSDELRSNLDAIGLQQVIVGDVVRDVDGFYGTLIDGLGADVVLIRPDLVMYGHADGSHVQELLSDLVHDSMVVAAR